MARDYGSPYKSANPLAAEDDPETEPCCICGVPTSRLYDDREDCPWCGSMKCGREIQAAMDYHDESGNR